MCIGFFFTCSAGATGREDCNFDPPLLFASFLASSFGVKEEGKEILNKFYLIFNQTNNSPFLCYFFRTCGERHAPTAQAAENRKGLRANTVFLAGSKKPRRPYPFEPRITNSSFLSVVQKGLYLLPMKLGLQEPLPTGSEAARGE